jgi:hypothetical protein
MSATRLAMTLPMLILLWTCPACRFCCKGPAGPAQPGSGPGGAEYKHNAITRTACGSMGRQYWLFEPDDPKPDSAPVIVFLHGWSATNPSVYGAWIKHIVRRGNIVIYPRYQTTILTPGDHFTPNTAMAINDAMQHLQSPGHVQPELDHLAFVGHSAGGAIAANLASAASAVGLPHPRAVMCVQPIDREKGKNVGIPFEDMSLIASDTLLLTIAGENDHLLGTLGARQIYAESIQIPYKNKNYLLFRSDNHGCPAISADHYSPVALDEDLDSGEPTFLPLGVLPWEIDFTPNAMDYFGYWKLLDALTDAAFYGTNREFAFGDTPQQRYLGTWVDNCPIKEPIVNQKCGLSEVVRLSNTAGTEP